MEFPIRINKYLADLGMATRRGADELIAKGVVLVNDKKAKIGQQIQARDVVRLSGDTPKKDYVYLAYHKPAGILTHAENEGDVDIASRVKKDYKLENVFPIGRLDKASEGLIILTNDGRITRRLLSPDQYREKEYLITVDKRMYGSVFKNLETGVRIEKYTTRPAKAERISPTVFKLTITEGKKHQIRRMCAALGYQVQKLVRIRIMNITLGKTKPGQFRIIKDTELTEFLTALGLA